MEIPMGQSQRLEISCGGHRRMALLRKPKNFQGSAPLVVVLHGAGGTANWTLEETLWDKYADEAGFLLLLPEGTREDMTRGAGFLQNPQVWNDGSKRSELAQQGVDDVAFLEDIIQHVMAMGIVSGNRFFMNGFSNGAGMTFRYCIEAKNKPAAIAPVSGLLSIDHYPHNLTIPTIYIMGKVDPLMPLEGGTIISPWTKKEEQRPSVIQTIHAWEKALGGVNHSDTKESPEKVHRTERHCGKGDVRFTSVLIDDLGHHWPGGRGTLNKRLAGQPSNRFHACSEIWKFWNS